MSNLLWAGPKHNFNSTNRSGWQCTPTLVLLSRSSRAGQRRPGCHSINVLMCSHWCDCPAMRSVILERVFPMGGHRTMAGTLLAVALSLGWETRA